jgi:hypothetical protein
MARAVCVGFESRGDPPLAFGVESIPDGLIGFAVVKLVGYSLFCLRLEERGPSLTPRFVLAGLTRTALGLAFGIPYTIAFSRWAPDLGHVTTILFFVGLFPIRLLEWHILFRIFFHRVDEPPPRFWYLAGTGISYLLDIPAMFGYFATGGLWIC